MDADFIFCNLFVTFAYLAKVATYRTLAYSCLAMTSISFNHTYRHLREGRFTGVRRGAGTDQPWQVWYCGAIDVWRSYESEARKALAMIKWLKEGGNV